jgi:hypothetical protein
MPTMQPVKPQDKTHYRQADPLIESLLLMTRLLNLNAKSISLFGDRKHMWGSLTVESDWECVFNLLKGIENGKRI